MAVDITDLKQAETQLLTHQHALVTLQERERIGCELHDWPENALSPVNELHLLRIIQEALVNVRKHSGAQ